MNLSNSRIVKVVLLVLLFCACVTPEPPPTYEEYKPKSDRDKLRWAMGWISRRKREIRYLTGSDPLNEKGIKHQLKEIQSELRSVSDLTPYENQTTNNIFHEQLNSSRKTIRKLIRQEWTGSNVRSRFKAMENTCGDCHKKIHPRANKEVKITEVMPNVDEQVMERLKKPAEQTCATCHEDIYKEWKNSYHAYAWKDPIYRKAAKIPHTGGKLKSTCTPCHSPMPILFEPYSVSYRFRPRYRPVNQDDAVNCKTCHLRPDGGVAARHTMDAPCNPKRTPRFLKPDFCSSCHNPTHNTHYEWQQSKAHDEGTTCADCHTKEVTRKTAEGGTRKGISHKWLGGTVLKLNWQNEQDILDREDVEFVKTAVDLECKLERESNRVTLKLTNLCGHKFPGEIPTRLINIRIEATGTSGNRVFSESIHYRRPTKSEIGKPDSRLRPDETRTVRWTLPDNAKTAEVNVHFQPSFFSLPKGWIELGSWTFDLKK